jgi:hypothetical protein
MKLVVVAFLILSCAAALAACVDGKTPDCTTIDSGCFPEDTGSPPVDSASDAPSASDASDASPPSDAPAG